MKICSIGGCNNEYNAKGLCKKHYHISPHGKKSKQKYRDSLKGKSTEKIYYTKYNNSDERKEHLKITNDHNNEMIRLRRATPEGKLKRKEEYLKNREHALKHAKERYNTPEGKSHHRNYTLLKEYGITLEEYNKMLKDQDNKCVICGKESIKLNVDHDHKTSKVRGLLCNQCNTGLGLFKDNTLILKNAIEYLRGHQ